MPRIRTIKPEFFTDEEIGRLEPLHRLAFIGIWCHADKAGRLEFRPARLKVQILPYDSTDFAVVLDALIAGGFLLRYHGSDGREYLQVRSFGKHQRPRSDEEESTIPGPNPDDVTVNDLFRDEPVTPQSLGKERKGKERKGGRPAEAIVELWNATVTAPIPKIEKITPVRRAKIETRLEEHPDLETWRRVFEFINGESWCRAPGTGAHPNWTATLDWLCKSADTFQKYVEQSAARAVRPVPITRPSGCRHDPPCANDAQHTQRYLAERKKAAS